MIELIEQVWDLNRSLVTDGYDQALEHVDEYLDRDLTVHEIPSGTDCWTWTVPPKWSVEKAYVSTGQERLVDYDHPLRVVTYSDSIDQWVSREELFEHLHWDTETQDSFTGRTLPGHPDALPYVFRFYDDEWGLCVRETELERFEGHDEFEVVIDTTFEPGSLKIGEYTVTGETTEEVFLMAHLDHPAQVNDDLAGVAVGAEVMRRLESMDTHYSYTLLIVPETIGSIAYFSQHEDRIDDFAYGIYLEMLGTDGRIALQHSFQGDAEIDRLAEMVLDARTESYAAGPFRQVIGNDEMVTNGPGLEIPTISLSRWPYDEYHTSLDTPEIVSRSKLQEAADVVISLTEALDRNRTPVRRFTGPPFLSNYGLWDKWLPKMTTVEQVCMYLDGTHTVAEIAALCETDFDTVDDLLTDLAANDLVAFPKARARPGSDHGEQ